MEMIDRLYRISVTVLFALLTLIIVVSITLIVFQWDGIQMCLFGN